ncbi:MAG: hypothetical protein LBK62_09720 [Treponema sp.]|jgi:DNA repair exonuclease SbcCD ATPase subunit|nr:hypothetical protein [Treponema sp.]
MGFFSFGNLLTFGIVAVSLILYRYLDKNNRNLDKVRKYADKCKEDIATYTEEKLDKVKGFGIDLEVERKAAMELLRHIRTLTEEELAEKVQTISRIDERIRAYDSSMGELVKMTGRVQENLNRIRDESAFVESTGKKVGNLKEKLESLEKALGGTEKRLYEAEIRFEKESTEVLEKTAEVVLAEARSRLSDFEASAETIERRVEDHREAVAKVELEREAALARDIETINKTLKEAVERAGIRADKIEDAALIKLRDQAQDRLKEFKNLWEEKIKTAQETVKTRLGEIQEQLKNNREEWKIESAGIETRQKAYRDEWKKDVQDLNALAKQQRIELSAAFAQQREELNAEAAVQRDELNTAINRQETEWSRRFQELSVLSTEQAETLSAAIAGQGEALNATLAQQREDLTSAITGQDEALSAALAQQCEDLTTAITGQGEALNAAVKQQREELNAKAAAQRDELNTAINRQETEWNRRFQELSVLSTEQAETLSVALVGQGESLSAALAQQREDLTTAITGQDEALNAAVKQQREELNAALTEQQDTLNAALTSRREEWEKNIQEQAALVRRQSGELDAAIVRQKEEWALLMQNAERNIITASEARLMEYRQAQAEEIKQLGNLSGDAARLETELRRSMQDMVGRVNADFAHFEEESRRTREAAAAEFDSQVQALRAELDKVDQELAGLKSQSIESVSEKLKLFEDDFSSDLGRRSADIERRLVEWTERLNARLEELADAGVQERQQTEARLNEELRQSLVEQGERLVSELERLKTETVAFEEGIREEMQAADETRRSFSEQLAQDLEEARNAAESEAKTQIGQYSLSMSETLRQNQRELEEQLKESGSRFEEQIAGLEASAENTRRDIEEWQGQCNARIRDLDISMEEIRRRNRDLAAENDERIVLTRSTLDDIRKELTAQAKLFDRTDELKLELERRVEDLNGDMDRLDQRKNEIADIERRFTQIKRLEDDVNAKMTRFLSEKRRIEVMETDFNRLLQTSQAVEEKLAQVSSSDDTLQAIQVQIRRLGDAIKETEEKYQRIERKSQTLEETNAGINRNFKVLQESEAALKNAADDIDRLSTEAESLRASIETLSAENEKARDAIEKLATLDESLSLIENRITEMNVAREWLARTETELQALDKDAQTQLRLIRSLLNRETGKASAGAKSSSGKAGTKGAPPPRDRDNIVKLRRQGWTVEEIAKTMDIARGEVELVLELSPKD